MPHEATHLYVGKDHDKPMVFHLAGGEVALFSCRAPDKVSLNEDSMCVLDVGDHRAVLAVADGCGGMSRGDIASRIAVQSLWRSVKAIPKSGTTLRTAILDGIERANQQVKDLGTGAGTTLAAVELDGESIRTFHIGDSQVLLVGNRGKVKLQTRSHSPVGYAVQAGMLSEEEAIHHEDRHVVSNVVGTQDMHIEIGPRRKLSPRDTLVIASDGLYDNLHIEEIVEIVRKGPLEHVAECLLARVLERMSCLEEENPSKPDDLTFLLFRLGRSRRN